MAVNFDMKTFVNGMTSCSCPAAVAAAVTPSPLPNSWHCHLQSVCPWFLFLFPPKHQFLVNWNPACVQNFRWFDNSEIIIPCLFPSATHCMGFILIVNNKESTLTTTSDKLISWVWVWKSHWGCSALPRASDRHTQKEGGGSGCLRNHLLFFRLFTQRSEKRRKRVSSLLWPVLVC